MMRSAWMAASATAALLGCAVALMAQDRSKETPSWAPKPTKKTVWTAPHKPHTKITEVRTQHAGEKAWRHLVVDDDHFTAAYVQMPSGAKVGRRFKPDTRTWWVVLDGQIKFTFEGQEPFVATKGSMVQVPMQTIYELETVGDQPSLRWEVDIAHAKTLYPQDVSPPKMEGFEFIPVVLSRKPQPYGYNNVPHINLYELAKRPEYTKGNGNFQHRFVHDDRGVSNVIYGYEKNLPPFNPKNRGHYHPECAEFWLVMEGQIRYPVEYAGDIIASRGDVVYVPPFTFHAPRFHGEGPSCRLAMNGYPNIAHLFDSEVPH